MVTYEFYRDVYGGTRDELSFEKAVSAADGVIRALLYPTLPGDLTEAQLAEYSRAVCMQLEYGLDDSGTSARIKSESLGDHSVTYEVESAASGLRVYGVAVSPQAVMLLEGAGLLSRWI